MLRPELAQHSCHTVFDPARQLIDQNKSSSNFSSTSSSLKLLQEFGHAHTHTYALTHTHIYIYTHKLTHSRTQAHTLNTYTCIHSSSHTLTHTNTHRIHKECLPCAALRPKLPISHPTSQPQALPLEMVASTSSLSSFP
jgi:hypothetical protein